MRKKILIIGGHVTPALAVIEKLESTTQWEILYVGRTHALEGDRSISVEYQLITNRKIPFRTLTTGRLQRSITRYTLVSLLKLVYGCIQGFLIVMRDHPAIILSFGGYMAVPIAFAGWILHIPIVTHEQTMRPGLANRVIDRFAQKICISWPESKKYFSENKVVQTGNPLRKEILQQHKKLVFKEKLPLIYITGGNLGSQTINKVVEEIVPQLLTSYTIVHQCGNAQNEKDYKRLLALARRLPHKLQQRYYLSPFIDAEHIGWVFHTARLLVTRAGANTITEIIALEKPSIVIPLPWSGNNEQLQQAHFLEQHNAGIVITQEILTSSLLHDKIKEAFMKEETLQANLKKLSSYIDYDAAGKIVRVLEELVGS